MRLTEIIRAKNCARFLHNHHRRSITVDTRNIPRRALMFVPGSDERKLNKIPHLKADCICLDCEDGVAFTAKDKARTTIRNLLETKSQDFFGLSECSVRVNSIQSGLCQHDLNEIMAPPPPNFLVPSSIHLPKVDEAEMLEEFTYMFNGVTGKWINPSSPTIGLILFIESAKAVMNLRSICTQALKLKDKSCLTVEALVFGSDDFVADIGAVRTESCKELLYARQKIVTHAKAFGMQCIDLVHINFKDLDSLRAQSIEGATMGFTGKQVIHPSQIPVVHEAFAPDKARVEWATELIKEFRKFEESGKGAFNFRGAMIDLPLVRQAENIVIMSEKMNALRQN